MDQSKIIQNDVNRYLSMEPRGLGYLLFSKLSEYGNDIKQICSETAVQETFSYFKIKCIRAALHMKRKGIVPQDIISICSYNTLNSAVPLIASFFIGVIPNTLDPSFSAEDFRYHLETVKPKLIFTCVDTAVYISDSIKELNLKTEVIVFGQLSPYKSFDDFLKPINGEESFEPFSCISIKDTVIILFSSGTTNKSKAICLNHINIFRFSSFYRFMPKQSRLLIFNSLFWITKITEIIGSIVYGHTNIVCSSFINSEDCYKIIQKNQVSAIYLGTFFLLELCYFCIKHGLTLPTCKPLTGGSRISKQLVEMIPKVFLNHEVQYTYGQTECGLISAYLHLKDDFIKKTQTKNNTLKGSSGVLLPGLSMKVVDIETEKTVGPNKIGEIRIMSHSLTNGYFHADSSEIYDSEGWFKTGDLGYFDEDEFIYVLGRRSETLQFSSFLSRYLLVEENLLKHPAVKNAVVLEIPLESEENHLAAFVTLNEGFKTDSEEIKRFADDLVDDSKKLRGGVVILENIPLTITGKIKISALKEMISNKKE